MRTYIKNLIWSIWIRRVASKPQVLFMDSPNWEAMVHEVTELLSVEQSAAVIDIVSKHQHFEAR
jgi:hypothetical protein